MDKVKVFIITSLLIFINPLVIEARFATKDEASIEYEYYNRDIEVKADNTYIETVEQQIHILNEQGRENFGTQYLYYLDGVEDIKIIEAKTIFEGKEYKIPLEMIEIKPLASSINGFDQIYQILLAYPKAFIGSKLYLKYKSTVAESPLENYYFTNFYYGGEGYWKNSKVTLKSALPFNIKVNDPNKVLDVRKAKNGDVETLNITLKKPIFTALVSESLNTQLEDELKTFVQVSTSKSFENIAKALAPNYEKVVDQPLPIIFEKIRQDAEKLENETNQINIITSELSNKVRYMGDWRTAKGKVFPRDLNKIVETGVGDCKDYAATTAAILNKIKGYKADVAIVMRRINYLSPENPLPNLSEFNHAIVKVITKNGKTFWIDPTNFTSMADGIYADIANRPALVLNSKNPTYEKIPEVDFKHARIEKDIVIDVKNNNVTHIDGKINYYGEEALFCTGLTLKTSLKEIEESFFYSVSNENHPLNKKIILPNLNSRIVKDISVSYSFEKENDFVLTNLGNGLLLPQNWTRSFLEATKDQQGALYLGSPWSMKQKRTILNAEASNLEHLNYQFQNPWFNAKRICRKVGDNIEIEDVIEILKKFVTAKEARSLEYQKIKADLKKYCVDPVLIFQKK